MALGHSTRFIRVCVEGEFESRFPALNLAFDGLVYQRVKPLFDDLDPTFRIVFQKLEQGPHTPQLTAASDDFLDLLQCFGKCIKVVVHVDAKRASRTNLDTAGLRKRLL